MTTDAAMVHGMFLFQGAVLAPKYDPDTHSGQIGLAYDLVPYAKSIDERLSRIPPNISWPGVFDYEVTEALGAWLMQNWPTTVERFEMEMEGRIKEYFEQ